MSTKIKFNHNVALNLIAYLPFDTSVTEDLCGNTWTANGSPTIANGALKLDGASYLETSGLEIGGRNFTIAGTFLMNSSSNSWCRLLEFNVDGSSTFFAIVRNSNYNTLRLEGRTSWVNADFIVNLSGSVLGTAVNIECDYVHDSGKFYIFYDGVLKVTVNVTFSRKAVQYMRLGASKYESGRGLNGTIDNFMIFDGVALHSENFTPLTDYAESVVTKEVPLVEGKPAGKRLAIYHNGETYYAPLVAPDDKTASAFHLTYGGTTYALCTNPMKYFAPELIAYLPFDTSATKDLCGNTWTEEGGTATISTDNAISGKALTGGEITLTTPIMLGGQDFTVDFWFKAFTNNYQHIYMWRNGESYDNGAGGLFGFDQSTDTFIAVYTAAGAGVREFVTSSLTSSMAHYAFVYQHSARTMKVYRNGKLVVTRTNVTINRTAHPAAIGSEAKPFAVDEFRVFDGVALWTENFTPPTDNDYAKLKFAPDSGSKSKSSSKQSAVIEEPEEDIQGGVSTSTDLLKANLFSINGMSAYTDLPNESISGISSINPAVAFAYSNAYALWGLSLPQL